LNRHFPDQDAAYKDANSIELLRSVWRLAAGQGFKLLNADPTIIAQRPRLAAFLDQMRANLAAAIDVEPQSVNVKAVQSGRAGRDGPRRGNNSHRRCATSGGIVEWAFLPTVNRAIVFFRATIKSLNGNKRCAPAFARGGYSSRTPVLSHRALR
jgi:hypothetical protein